MGEIKITGEIVTLKSDKTSETSNANEPNIKDSLQDELQKLPFTINKKSGEKTVDAIGETKN